MNQTRSFCLQKWFGCCWAKSITKRMWLSLAGCFWTWTSSCHSWGHSSTFARRSLVVVLYSHGCSLGLAVFVWIVWFRFSFKATPWGICKNPPSPDLQVQHANRNNDLHGNHFVGLREHLIDQDAELKAVLKSHIAHRVGLTCKKEHNLTFMTGCWANAAISRAACFSCNDRILSSEYFSCSAGCVFLGCFVLLSF